MNFLDLVNMRHSYGIMKRVRWKKKNWIMCWNVYACLLRP